MAKTDEGNCLGAMTDMTSLAAAYDNIRLIRRKIAIARQAVALEGPNAARDAAIIQVASLADDLVDAVQDFADAGFEQQMADLVADQPERRAAQ